MEYNWVSGSVDIPAAPPPDPPPKVGGLTDFSLISLAGAADSISTRTLIFFDGESDKLEIEDLVRVEFGVLAERMLFSADSFSRFAGRAFDFLEGFPEFLEGVMVSREEPETF